MITVFSSSLWTVIAPEYGIFSLSEPRRVTLNGEPLVERTTRGDITRATARALQARGFTGPFEIIDEEVSPGGYYHCWQTNSISEVASGEPYSDRSGRIDAIYLAERRQAQGELDGSEPI